MTATPAVTPPIFRLLRYFFVFTTPEVGLRRILRPLCCTPYCCPKSRSRSALPSAVIRGGARLRHRPFLLLYFRPCRTSPNAGFSPSRIIARILTDLNALRCGNGKIAEYYNYDCLTNRRRKTQPIVGKDLTISLSQVIITKTNGGWID